MGFVNDALPVLSDAVCPPVVLGTAELTHFAYQGADHDSMIARLGAAAAANNTPANAEVARIYDTAIACQLAFRRAEGLNLQDVALESSQIYRVAGAAGAPVRLLALVSPGDLMTNTPLDFLTRHVDVRLDLLYVMPGQPLPPVLPDHDIAFFAIGEAGPATQQRLQTLFAIWPLPALNDPAFLPVLARDALSQALAGLPGIVSPTAVSVGRGALERHLRSGHPIDGFGSVRALYPCLIRPASSHAGTDLALVERPADLAEYLRFSFERRFFVTRYEEYAGIDGYYRKYRIAFVDREPFLCHMAVSQAWMVHYLNAGMTESAAKRAEEAKAMATFETGFARRHAKAFSALHKRLGFDYYSIDCAETRDGRLLVFEADAAAIVHLMDPPDLFPYKQAPMQRVFEAFRKLLVRRMAEAGGVGRTMSAGQLAHAADLRSAG